MTHCFIHTHSLSPHWFRTAFNNCGITSCRYFTNRNNTRNAFSNFWMPFQTFCFLTFCSHTHIFSFDKVTIAKDTIQTHVFCCRSSSLSLSLLAFSSMCVCSSLLFPSPDCLLLVCSAKSSSFLLPSANSELSHSCSQCVSTCRNILQNLSTNMKRSSSSLVHRWHHRDEGCWDVSQKHKH